MDYMALSAAEWQQEYDKVSAEYESWKAKGLKSTWRAASRASSSSTLSAAS